MTDVLQEGSRAWCRKLALLALANGLCMLAAHNAVVAAKHVSR
jgi:hypothetical protein